MVSVPEVMAIIQNEVNSCALRALDVINVNLG